MTRVVEAIFENGTLRPVEALDLREHERVRVTIESMPGAREEDAREARRQLIEGFRRSKLRLTGPMPSRDVLHER